MQMGNLEDMNSASQMETVQPKRRRQRRGISFEACRRTIRTRAKATVVPAAVAGAEPASHMVGNSTLERDNDSNTEFEDSAGVKDEDVTSEHSGPLTEVSNQIHVIRENSACEKGSSSGDVGHDDSEGLGCAVAAKRMTEVEDVCPVDNEHSGSVHSKTALPTEGLSESICGQSFKEDAPSSSGVCKEVHQTGLGSGEDTTCKALLQQPQADAVARDHSEEIRTRSPTDVAAAQKDIEGPDLERPEPIVNSSKPGNETEVESEICSETLDTGLHASDSSECDKLLDSADCETGDEKLGGKVLGLEERVSTDEIIATETGAVCETTVPKAVIALKCEPSCEVVDILPSTKSEENIAEVHQNVPESETVNTGNIHEAQLCLPLLASSRDDNGLILVSEQSRSGEDKGEVQGGDGVTQTDSDFAVADSSSSSPAGLSTVAEVETLEISIAGIGTVVAVDSGNAVDSGAAGLVEISPPCGLPEEKSAFLEDSSHRPISSPSSNQESAVSERAEVENDSLTATLSGAEQSDVDSSTVPGDFKPISSDSAPEGSQSVVPTAGRIGT